MSVRTHNGGVVFGGGQRSKRARVGNTEDSVLTEADSCLFLLYHLSWCNLIMVDVTLTLLLKDLWNVGTISKSRETTYDSWKSSSNELPVVACADLE